MKLVICGFLRSPSLGRGRGRAIIWLCGWSHSNICHLLTSGVTQLIRLTGSMSPSFLLAPCISPLKLCQILWYFKNNFLSLMALIKSCKLGMKEFNLIKSLGNLRAKELEDYSRNLNNKYLVKWTSHCSFSEGPDPGTVLMSLCTV